MHPAAELFSSIVIVAWGVVFALRVPTMSIQGFTPPRASLNTPSTGTSSGSLLTKEPAATRPKLEHGAAASCVPGPQRSTAGLLVEARQTMRSTHDDQLSDTGGGGSVVPGYSSTGAPEPDANTANSDSSDLEEVGSSSSSSWQPRP